VIARGEISSVIGPPGGGKSSFATDIVVHATNRSSTKWRGYFHKITGTAVYFALERADLTKRRLMAHKLRDKLPKLPIAVAGRVINLMDKGCINDIVDAIKRAEDHCGVEAVLAVFDTYSKGIAAGGGDENKARDQNIALTNLRSVIDKINVHILTVGHTGKEPARGERGSNAKLADIDVEITVTSGPIKTATVTKANDQPEGVLTSFKLEPYEFGPDEDEEPVRTFIVSPEEIAALKPRQGLSSKQRLAVEALTEALLNHGRAAPPEYKLPQGIKIVAEEHWKTELFRRGVLDKNGRNHAARYTELRIGLHGRHAIGVLDGHVWLPATNNQSVTS
jgi:hypothetical protein